jgi:hypothetical protein
MEDFQSRRGGPFGLRRRRSRGSSCCFDRLELVVRILEVQYRFAERSSAARGLGQNSSEEEQNDTVHRVVGVAIPQAGHNLPTAAFAVPDNQPSYIPRPSVGILSPDHVAVFNLTASQPASATLREWPLQRVLGA